MIGILNGCLRSTLSVRPIISVIQDIVHCIKSIGIDLVVIVMSKEQILFHAVDILYYCPMYSEQMQVVILSKCGATKRI